MQYESNKEHALDGDKGKDQQQARVNQRGDLLVDDTDVIVDGLGNASDRHLELTLPTERKEKSDQTPGSGLSAEGSSSTGTKSNNDG